MKHWLSDRHVLVTGGAGYIGAHACKALAASGFVPVVYDNLSTGHADAVRWGPLEVGNILDETRLLAVLRTYRPVAVMHFAALAYVGESVTEPARYYHTNVAGTLNLVRCMARRDVHKLVFSSSCATYGTPDALPIRETTPQMPINPYGASKLMGERIIADICAATPLQAIALRYFNAAGADPDGEIGERHDPETHLIPLIFDAACGRRPSLTLFGTDYDTRDGSCVRDYVHVSDLASAHLAALQALSSDTTGASFRSFNLGTGRGYSIFEVIAAAEAVTGLEVPVVIGPRRAGDPAALYTEAEAARRELGWTPRFKDLEAVLQTAWNFYQAQAARASAATKGVARTPATMPGGPSIIAPEARATGA